MFPEGTVERLKRTLSPVYWRTRARVQPEQTLSINGTEATFATESRTEHKNISRAHGERGLLRRFLASIDSETVVWDVGANIGVYTCLAARHAGEVISFEADPYMAPRCLGNVARNDIVDAVTVLPLGLGEERTRKQLRVNQWLKTGERTVRIVPGDELPIPKPDVVKVDVEGAEIDVLRGCQDAFSDIESMFIEVHPDRLDRRGYETTALRDELHARGLTVKRLDTAGAQPHWHATRE